MTKFILYDKICHNQLESKMTKRFWLLKYINEYNIIC